mmetsp:Transcript_24978/g.80698  ORF Transcript_24978/g.80698 Transcript_24978/m.80698 type:complete len:225 (+) Transcript_24978:521-1195(+)
MRTGPPPHPYTQRPQAQTPLSKDGTADASKHKRPRLGRRRFPMHHHFPHATGRTHPLQTHHPHRALTTRERGLTPQYGTLCRMCGLRRENSLHMGECNVIRKLFMRINSLKALEHPFIFPLTHAARTHQAIRILFATPAEGAPQAIVNFMIILWKNILISFYKVDLENQPFDPNIVWRCTLKRFADLALALAHDARTKQLLAIGRGEPPPSLNSHQARLSRRGR